MKSSTNLHTVSVISNQIICQHIVLSLSSEERNFAYEAGQYVVVHWKGEEKYMSLASAPCERDLLFVMNNSESDFKRAMSALRPGDMVLLSSPDGSLTINNLRSDTAHHVFIAGGIGVTPFRSMLRELKEQRDDRRFTLLHSYNASRGAIFEEEIASFESALDNFRYVPVKTSQENDRINKQLIEKYIDDPTVAHYYFAGSHPFIADISAILLNQLDVARTQISAEVFCGYCPEHVCCCAHVGELLHA